MPPGYDIGDDRVELFEPLTLDGDVLRARSNHFLYLVGRLAPARDADRRARRARDAARTMASGHPRRPRAEPRRTPPALRRLPGADRRWRPARGVGAAGGRGLRAADCLRQPGQPAAGPRRGPTARVRHAPRAWRRPRTPAPPVHDRRPGAVARRRRARPRPCRVWRASPDHLAPRFAAARAPCHGRSHGARLYDWRGMLTGVAFGLAPLLHLGEGSVAQTLRDGMARTTAGSASQRIRKVFVAGGAGARRRARRRRRTDAPDGVEPRTASMPASIAAIW